MTDRASALRATPTTAAPEKDGAVSDVPESSALVTPSSTGKPSSLEEAYQDGLTAFFRSLNRGMIYSLTEKGRKALGR
jgi:hypothetical protein